MDIYKYAEEINYAADYMDHTSCYIYAITEAKDNDGKIPVYDLDENNKKVFIGFAKKNN